MQLYQYDTLQYTLLIKNKRNVKTESRNGKEKSIMILDFILAALPWIICGIAVAVICVGNDQACSQKKQAMEEKHIGIGAGIGFAAGAVIAILVPEKGDHTGILIAMGPLVGMAIVTVIDNFDSFFGKNKKK